MSGVDVAIVGGCGHVGLPLGLAFASRGLDVSLYDLNATAVASVNEGRLPFDEPGALEVLHDVLSESRIRATTSASAIRDADTVVIVIGTPIDEHLNPDLHAVQRAIEDIAASLTDGQLLVLRSTVYPGVTAMVERLVERLGIAVDVAFCPERIAEGKAMTELFELPQIVASRSVRAQRARDEAVPHPLRRGRLPRARGGRAGEALHQHLALHQVRDGEPALHDGQRLRARLRAHPQRRHAQLPASGRPARRRASRPARACSRTRCNSPRSTTTTSTWARPASPSTRGCRSTWWRDSSSGSTCRP